MAICPIGEASISGLSIKSGLSATLLVLLMSSLFVLNSDSGP